MPKRFSENKVGTSRKKVGRSARRIRAKAPSWVLKAPVEYRYNEGFRLVGGINEKFVYANAASTMDHPKQWYDMLSVNRVLGTNTSTAYTGAAANTIWSTWQGIKVAAYTKRFTFKNNCDTNVYLTCFLVKPRDDYVYNQLLGDVDYSLGTENRMMFQGNSNMESWQQPLLALWAHHYYMTGTTVVPPTAGTHQQQYLIPNTNAETPISSTIDPVCFVQPMNNTIFDSSTFTRYYVVKKVIKKKLTVGSTFVLKHNSRTRGIHKMRNLISELATDGTPSTAEITASVAERQSFWLWQIHGDIGHITNGADTSDSIATTCPTGITNNLRACFLPCALDVMVDTFASWNPLVLESETLNKYSDGAVSSSVYGIGLSTVEGACGPPEGDTVIDDIIQS